MTLAKVRERATRHDIAPCPFCGVVPVDLDRTERFGTPPPEATEDDGMGWWAFAVACHGCAAVGPWRKTSGGAIGAWNRRTS